MLVVPCGGEAPAPGLFLHLINSGFSFIFLTVCTKEVVNKVDSQNKVNRFYDLLSLKPALTGVLSP